MRVKHKHLIARVDEKFYREVKIQLARRGITMHRAITQGVAHELGIELSKFNLEVSSELAAVER